jgi:hypothetical protein
MHDGEKLTAEERRLERDYRRLLTDPRSAELLDLLVNLGPERALGVLRTALGPARELEILRAARGGAVR